MNALPATFAPAPREAVQTDVSKADGIGVRLIVIPDAGTFVPQHSHRYDHITVLAVGRMKVWADGVFVGEFTAPHALRIPGGVKHTMQALTDDLQFYCIHNISRTGEPEELERHALVPTCDGDCGRCAL